MKIISIITAIILTLQTSTAYGQDLTSNEALKLEDLLNNTFAENLQLTFKENMGKIQWDTINKTLDLRHASEIARDSMSSKEIKTKFYHLRRYIGPIYWKYNFEDAASSKVNFRANKRGQLFMTFSFEEQDTLFIKSNLNEFSSHHRTSDSGLHQVLWSGEKYISLLLQPKKETNTIQFYVRGVTLSGKFERKDHIPIRENYLSTLRALLKREFQQLFEQIILNTNTSKNGSNHESIEIITISN